MAYLALYRQWRPKRFSDFVGQDAVISALKNQVRSGRIGHAYLFSGSRGTGKTSAAKVFALAINCLNPQEGEACGVCENCLRLSQETTMDIVEIDAASNNGVDEIRDLRDKVAYPPQDGKYRVYIIDEVHMLSSGAFNALLKTLEEPPAHAVFILATTEPQRLPATILSRCQRYDFRRIPLPQLVLRLSQAAERAGVDATPQALERIARAAEGGARDALSILDMCLSLSDGTLDESVVLDVLGASDREFLFRFAGAMIGGDTAGAMQAVADLVSLGREVSVFARDVLQHLRQLMLAQSCGDGLQDLLEITEEDALRLSQQGEQVSRERLLYIMDLFLTADTDLKWSSQPRIAIEMAAVRACLPPVILDGTIEQRVAALETAVQNGIPAAQPAAAHPPKAAPPAPTPAPQAATPPAQEDVPWSTDDDAPPAQDSAEPASPAEPVPPVAAEAPAAPTAAPAAAGGARSAAMVWKDFENMLKRDAPALFSMVKQGRLLGREGNHYNLGFTAQGEIYKTMLEQPGKMEQMVQILSSAAQTESTLSLSMEKAPKQSAAAANQTLQDIFDSFGRENVQVLRDDEKP